MSRGLIFIRLVTSESRRRNISLVGQDVVLLDDTLRNNLIFRLERQVEDSDVTQAVAGAYLEELMESLPKGLETRLEADGVTLSGGQRRLTAIARALLKQAPVLIVDEASNFFDSETERFVQKAIENVARGCTSFVIAHRLSTIQWADKIVVLERGRVSEEGTLPNLLDCCGRFYAIWKAQFFDRPPAEDDTATRMHAVL